MCVKMPTKLAWRGRPPALTWLTCLRVSASSRSWNVAASCSCSRATASTSFTLHHARHAAALGGAGCAAEHWAVARGRRQGRGGSGEAGHAAARLGLAAAHCMAPPPAQRPAQPSPTHPTCCWQPAARPGSSTGPAPACQSAGSAAAAREAGQGGCGARRKAARRGTQAAQPRGAHRPACLPACRASAPAPQPARPTQQTKQQQQQQARREMQTELPVSAALRPATAAGPAHSPPPPTPPRPHLVVRVAQLAGQPLQPVPQLAQLPILGLEPLFSLRQQAAQVACGSRRGGRQARAGVTGEDAARQTALGRWFASLRGRRARRAMRQSLRRRGGGSQGATAAISGWRHARGGRAHSCPTQPRLGV